MHDAPAGSVVGQLLVWLNSPKSCSPPIEMVPIVMPAPVVLVIVTGIGALAPPTGTLPNAKELVDADMVKPTPLRAMLWVSVTSSSEIVIVPAAGPGSVGLKEMLM